MTNRLIMIEKDPTSYSLITYLWVFGLALWGGSVSFISKVKKGVARAWNFTEFLGELLVSSFSGIITFYLCELSETPALLSAVFVAVSGHMGTRIVYLLEHRLEKKARKIFDSIDDE